jgi:hypothetical protein
MHLQGFTSALETDLMIMVVTTPENFLILPSLQLGNHLFFPTGHFDVLKTHYQFSFV